MALPEWYIAFFFVVPGIFTAIGVRRHLKTKKERKAIKKAKADRKQL